MIETTVCDTTKLGFATGVHTPQDKYYIALYKPGADIGAGTAKYSTTDEVSGAGYTPGGLMLSGYKAILDNRVACITWNDPLWEHASIESAGALIYNASKGDAAVATISFGGVKKSVNGDFAPNFPACTYRTAVVRIK